MACLLNVSEARRKDLVETVAKAALYNTEGEFKVPAEKKFEFQHELTAGKLFTASV